MRKQTKFQVCEAHNYLAGESKQRRAEMFCEGGPGSGPACSESKPCRIWPGTDLFVPSVCESESSWPTEWAVNQ